MAEKYQNKQDMTKDQKELESLQLKKLKKQLRYEWDSSDYYRELLNSAKVVPEKLESLEELQKIPIFTKDDHRKSQEESLRRFGHPYGLFLCCPLEKVVQINATSGTTGMPTFYTFSKKDIQIQSLSTSRVYLIYF